MQHLKEVLRKIEDRDSDTEWQRLEKEIRTEFDRLEKADADKGNEKSHAVVNQLRTQTDQVIRSKDLQMGREILEQIKGLFVSLNLIEILIVHILQCHEDFNDIHWTDSSRARQLINQAMNIIRDNPSVDKLRPIAIQIYELLPDGEKANAGGLLQQED